ncbi:hypothetical protein IWQ60_001703 [Tieghemiomyces parasiticus]|uniref:DUF218 domain-containing protein n=1 Tax=Tieghemiomyces parasiticus TaxID=78921 RepID=A0A9W8ADJ0_9FUNG|nr:hypothetical protein IWQ60_001703 [Tieghemiomyces parasiticus]
MSLHIRITPSNEPDELPANFTRGARNAAWPFRLRNLVRRYLRRSAQHGPWLLVGLALSVILNLYLLGHGTASLDLVAPSERPGSGIPHPGNHHPSHPPGHHGPEHDENAALISLAPTLPADWSRSALAAQYRGLTELIVVTGNAVFWGNPYDMAHVAHGESWALEPFQTESDVAGFLEHIRMGSDMLAQRPESLLVFSGGQTKPQAGMRSEAQSYWQLAQGQGWFKSDNLWRATTEEFARDSFENILFSMCRFYELTGHYPRKLSVISYPFKQKRYETLHRVALKIPETM